MSDLTSSSMSMGLVRNPVQPALAAFLFGPLHGIGSQRDDRSFKALFTQNPGCRITVHHRHLHIHENQIKRSMCDRVDCLLAVACRLYRRTGAGQHQIDQLAIRIAIIHNEDAGGRQSCAGLLAYRASS